MVETFTNVHSVTQDSGTSTFQEGSKNLKSKIYLYVVKFFFHGFFFSNTYVLVKSF